MRPDPACRTFNSSAVEVRRFWEFEAHVDLTGSFQKVIFDMKARLKDPDLARLFENAFPNTLGTVFLTYALCDDMLIIHVLTDTTVKYFNTVRRTCRLIARTLIAADRQKT